MPFGAAVLIVSGSVSRLAAAILLSVAANQAVGETRNPAASDEECAIAVALLASLPVKPWSGQPLSSVSAGRSDVYDADEQRAPRARRDFGACKGFRARAEQLGFTVGEPSWTLFGQPRGRFVWLTRPVIAADGTKASILVGDRASSWAFTVESEARGWKVDEVSEKIIPAD